MFLLKLACIKIYCIFATKTKRDNMCTVRIKVDETVMQRINPSLTSNELIGEWLQEQVDMLIEEYESPDMSVEELYHAIEQDVKAIYAD